MLESSKSPALRRVQANSSSSRFNRSMPLGVARSIVGLRREPAAGDRAARARSDRRDRLAGARGEGRLGRAVEQAQRVHEELERRLLRRRDALVESTESAAPARCT